MKVTEKVKTIKSKFCVNQMVRTLSSYEMRNKVYTNFDKNGLVWIKTFRAHKDRRQNGQSNNKGYEKTVNYRDYT